MDKKACKTTFPSRCLLSGSWYFSQQRVHYQAISSTVSVLYIKPVMIVTNSTLGELRMLCFLNVFHSHLDYNHKTRVTCTLVASYLNPN